MPMLFLESWAFHTDVRQYWDNVPTSIRESEVIDPTSDDNLTLPDGSTWIIEVGNQNFGTQAKQLTPTDELVVGFQYKWKKEFGITPSVDIEFEELDFTNIAKLNILGAGFAIAGNAGVHGLDESDDQAFFEVRVKRHPTLGEVEVWVNGVQKLIATNLALGTVDIEFLRIGTAFQNPSFEQFSHMFFEDISGEGAYTPKGTWFISQVSGVSINTNLDFTDPTNILAGQPGNATAGQVGAKLLANVPGNTATATTIHAVQLGHSISKSGTEPLEYSLNMSISGTNVVVPPAAIGSLALHTFTQIMSEDPSDQTPLSIADVATVIGGIEITSRGL